MRVFADSTVFILYLLVSSFLQFPRCDDAIVLQEPLVLCLLHCLPFHRTLLRHEPGTNCLVFLSNSVKSMRIVELFPVKIRHGFQFILSRDHVLPLQLLAVVFDTFNDVEKMKFKSLLLHKRSAIDHAFQLLVSRQVWHLTLSQIFGLNCFIAPGHCVSCHRPFSLQRPMGVSLKQFDGLMRFYRPRMSARDRFLTYKALNIAGAPMLRWLPDTLFVIYSKPFCIWSQCHIFMSALPQSTGLLQVLWSHWP